MHQSLNEKRLILPHSEGVVSSHEAALFERTSHFDWKNILGPRRKVQIRAWASANSQNAKANYKEKKINPDWPSRRWCSARGMVIFPGSRAHTLFAWDCGQGPWTISSTRARGKKKTKKLGQWLTIWRQTQPFVELEITQGTRGGTCGRLHGGRKRVVCFLAR